MTRLKMLWPTFTALCLAMVAGCGGGAAMSAPKSAEMPASYAEADGMAAPAPESAPAMDASYSVERKGDGGAGLPSGGQLAQAAPPPAPPSGAPGHAAEGTPGADPTRPPGPAPTATDAIAGPLLIYTARLNLAVFEAVKAIDAVEGVARGAGGYLVIRDDVTITIRVPSARFNEVLAKVMELGDVLGRNVEVRDVTEEYYDLETRLRNQEAVLKRLKELLERASSVEDALKVEAELSRVATEVETLKGRLKLLRELVAYSTITVTFAPTATEQVGSKVNLPFPWLGTLGLGNLLSL